MEDYESIWKVFGDVSCEGYHSFVYSLPLFVPDFLLCNDHLRIKHWKKVTQGHNPSLSGHVLWSSTFKKQNKNPFPLQERIMGTYSLMNVISFIFDIRKQDSGYTDWYWQQHWVISYLSLVDRGYRHVSFTYSFIILEIEITFTVYNFTYKNAQQHKNNILKVTSSIVFPQSGISPMYFSFVDVTFT